MYFQYMYSLSESLFSSLSLCLSPLPLMSQLDTRNRKANNAQKGNLQQWNLAHTGTSVRHPARNQHDKCTYLAEKSQPTILTALNSGYTHLVGCGVARLERRRPSGCWPSHGPWWKSLRKQFGVPHRPYRGVSTSTAAAVFCCFFTGSVDEGAL